MVVTQGTVGYEGWPALYPDLCIITIFTYFFLLSSLYLVSSVIINFCSVNEESEVLYNKILENGKSWSQVCYNCVQNKVYMLDRAILEPALPSVPAEKFCNQARVATDD